MDVVSASESSAKKGGVPFIPLSLFILFPNQHDNPDVDNQIVTRNLRPVPLDTNHTVLRRTERPEALFDLQHPIGAEGNDWKEQDDEPLHYLVTVREIPRTLGLDALSAEQLLLLGAPVYRGADTVERVHKR